MTTTAGKRATDRVSLFRFSDCITTAVSHLDVPAWWFRVTAKQKHKKINHAGLDVSLLLHVHHHPSFHLFYLLIVFLHLNEGLRTEHRS